MLTIIKPPSITLPFIPSPQGRGNIYNPLPWRERARVRGPYLLTT